jgi:hypothetical protein
LERFADAGHGLHGCGIAVVRDVYNNRPVAVEDDGARLHAALIRRGLAYFRANVTPEHLANRLRTRNVGFVVAVHARNFVEQTQDGGMFVLTAPVQRFLYRKVAAHQRFDLADERFAADTRAFRQCIKLRKELFHARVLSFEHRSCIH